MGRFIQRWFDKLRFGTRSRYFRRQLKYKIVGISITGFIILSIVNNGNILTDGRRYRRRPKIEMYMIFFI